MTKRADVPKQYLWNITDMYESDSLWEQQLAELREETAAFGKTGGITIGNLYEVLAQRDRLAQRVDYLYVYANLKANEDSTLAKYQAMSDKAEGLLTAYSTATAFIEPGILALDRQQLLAELQQQPLSHYRHYIEDILRSGQHILSRDKEELLSLFYEVGAGASNIYAMVENADMVFPPVEDSKGESHSLTHGTFISLLESSDRTLRQNAFKALYATYYKQKNTLAAIYSASVKKDIAFARARGYKDSLSAMLNPGNIPTEVYEGLIATVNRHLPLLHRYVALRKKMLGVEQLHFYDLYTPFVKAAEARPDYEEAKATVLKALQPLGKEYTARLEAALNKEGWVDVYENQGKRSGAYCWGAYGCHPFVSLNYNNGVDSVFTLAHEMGHAMHSHYSWTNQPFVYSDYTIFTAEVASTVNEALLMEHLLADTRDKAFRLYLINYFMEQFRGTLFRQTMFAEFELEAHRLVEQGEALTFEGLNSLYLSLNRKYFGEGIVYDEEIAWEWARIPHFYTAYYVYQYATGYSAAIALSKSILEHNGAEKYLGFLKSGSSDYSIELLKGAGVDMTTGEPVEQALKVFEGLLEQMEKE